MDKMDSLLERLPVDQPPDYLAERICRTIRLRRRQATTLRMASSAFLALAGVWLIFPLVSFWARSLALPASGLGLTFDWLSLALEDMGSLFNNVLSSLASLETVMILGSRNAVPGAVALGLSALLLLDTLLPREETR